MKITSREGKAPPIKACGEAIGAFLIWEVENKCSLPQENCIKKPNKLPRATQYLLWGHP